MDIIIIGAGGLGYGLARSLSEENHNITVIDRDENLVNQIVDKLDVQGVVGSGSIRGVLEDAGVKKANLVIATTSSDENNILSCFIARRMGARHTIARVRNPEYTKQINFMRSELGISMMINPDLTAALEISRVVQIPSAMNVESFAGGLVDMAEVKVSPSSPLVNMKLEGISSKYKNKVLICAVARGNEVFIPNGDFAISAGDKVYITSSHKNLGNIARDLSPTSATKNIKDIMIVGGSRIAFYLANLLESQSKNVVLIENNLERCNDLSEMLENTTVMYGDANEYDFLKEVAIDKMDAVITLTGYDELNIMVSAFAASVNVPKNITKIDNQNLAILLDKFSSDSVISVNDISIDTITHYIRAKEHVSSGEMKTLYTFADGKVEAAEFVVDMKTKYLEQPFNEIPFKRDLLIASISRKNKIIIPRGSDEICIGDRIIVVSKDRKIKEINDIFD